jgi:hypothetical protein
VRLPAAPPHQQAADWVVRSAVHGEDQTSIAREEGIPVDRVRKRIERLTAWVRSNADKLAVAMLVLIGTWTLSREKETGTGTAPHPRPPVEDQGGRRTGAGGSRSAPVDFAIKGSAGARSVHLPPLLVAAGNLCHSSRVMSEELRKLIEAARARPRMSAVAREEQTRNFAAGNVGLENARVTRVVVDEAARHFARRPR